MDDDGHAGTDSNPMESDPGKMFIGGLHCQTTADCLQRYFEKYGDVKECVVMRDAVTKRSRGFGFVRFVDPKSVEQVQASRPHSIDGKEIDPKRAIPKRQPPGANQFKKVFVGGLPPDVNVQEVKEYFEVFGKVTDCLLLHDRNTKRLRGFGFVTFESDAAGKHVCETGFHKLKGKNVECKKAQPKEVMLLQGKGRGFLVNLAPFPFTRAYPNGMGASPVGFGFPDWSLNPQLYQLANAMQCGRARGYARNNYAPTGFLNMPDHRRSYPDYGSVHSPSTNQAQDVNTTVANAVTTDSIPHLEYDQHNVYSSVQLTQYGPQATQVVTPASLSQAFSQTTTPRLDVGGYLNPSSRTGIPVHEQHLFHNGHTSGSPQTPFGHGMTQIPLRH